MNNDLINEEVSMDEFIENYEGEKYLLRLFVTGITPKSTRAIDNIKRICEAYLCEIYELEVIDIYQQPHLAEEEQIIAAPTLIKKSPLPVRRLIGDMSNTDKVLRGLDLWHKRKGNESIKQ